MSHLTRANNNLKLAKNDWDRAVEKGEMVMNGNQVRLVSHVFRALTEYMDSIVNESQKGGLL